MPTRASSARAAHLEPVAQLPRSGARATARGEMPTLGIECLLWTAGVRNIAGIDEAGRGAWAGPVVAAAVILDPARTEELLRCVRDSKQLTAKERTAAATIVRHLAVACGVGIVAPIVVDRAGLAFAGQLAFWRAVKNLPRGPDYLLVDGFPLWSETLRQTAVLQGDQRCLSIAAASVIAKVTRDQLMCSLERDQARYGFARHKGYGSPAHAEALRAHGPSEHHRRSFKPVAEICGGSPRPPAQRPKPTVRERR